MSPYDRTHAPSHGYPADPPDSPACPHQQCVIRETEEESGLNIEITGLLGIYTDPEHIIESADGEIRQEFNITFYGRVVGGRITVSNESTEVGF
ncbi:NUDIX hydrolase [Nocardia sp. CA-084685]|uniref:NUDIX hydrolase n=1 Tax=Nocardia sp. CA-084685 TaxID=3239970 RepID=UPI003D9788C6